MLRIGLSVKNRSGGVKDMSIKRALIFAIVLISLNSAIASAQKISVGSYEVERNSTFTVPVLAYNLSSIAGIDVALSYNPSVVVVQSYQLSSYLASCFKFDNVDNSKGLARVVIVCTDGISAEQLEIINFTLKASGNPGDKTDLKISANFSDTSFKLVVPETESGYVKISGGEIKTGGTSGTGGAGEAVPFSPGVTGSAEPSETVEETAETTKTSKTTPETIKVNETGEAREVNETVYPPESKPEIQLTPTKTPTPSPATPEKTEKIKETDKSELTPPPVNKTSIENKAGRKGLFKIPGFGVFLALLAIVLSWRWKK